MIRKDIKNNASTVFLSILGLWLLFILFPGAALSIEEEYKVKAVFLERFTRFVEWPEDADMDDPSTPFIICVIGNNPFEKILEQAYEKRRILGKPVEIRYISSLKDIAPCHLLFISSSMKVRLEEILSYTKDKSILTIGDTEGFAEKGVHINFYLREESARFTINETAVRNSSLKMDFRLLQYAKIVNPVERKE